MGIECPVVLWKSMSGKTTIPPDNVFPVNRKF